MSRREAPTQLFNLIVSNVPGPRECVSTAGAVVTEFYPVGPLAAGAALNVTVWSYVDQLIVAVLADENIVRDAHELTDAFGSAFTELLTTAPGPAETFSNHAICTTEGKQGLSTSRPLRWCHVVLHLRLRHQAEAYWRRRRPRLSALP
jgi:WS/DGAT C-terminal domain